jgi:hypothetical protein
MGKKTLYLDLDGVDALEAALSRLPGKPSVSSYLSQQLPQMAEVLDKMSALLVPGATRESVAMGVNAAFDDALQVLVDAKGVARKFQTTPPNIPAEGVPAPKPKRQKKLA